MELTFQSFLSNRDPPFHGIHLTFGTKVRILRLNLLHRQFELEIKNINLCSAQCLQKKILLKNATLDSHLTGKSSFKNLYYLVMSILDLEKITFTLSLLYYTHRRTVDLKVKIL